MFRVFNSCQFVAMFAGLPYLMSWLATNPFPYAEAAFWTAGVSYVVMGFIMVGAVYDSSKDMYR